MIFKKKKTEYVDLQDYITNGLNCRFYKVNWLKVYNK